MYRFFHQSLLIIALYNFWSKTSSVNIMNFHSCINFNGWIKRKNLHYIYSIRLIANVFPVGVKYAPISKPQLTSQSFPNLSPKLRKNFIILEAFRARIWLPKTLIKPPRQHIRWEIGLHFLPNCKNRIVLKDYLLIIKETDFNTISRNLVLNQTPY